MRLTLYVVHGSHPCAAVEKALTLKGMEYSRIEWPPPMHAPIQWVMFGARTVPAVKITADDGSTEKISGSRAIMRRLEQINPEPPLYPTDPAQRRAVEEAERWGDEVFQQLGRTLVWPAMKQRPDAMVSYSEGSAIPVPKGAIRLSAPLLARLACAINGATDDVARKDLEALPGYLDKVDDWIGKHTIGDAEHPNAADLQIASTIRLIMTLADALPLIGGRPCAALARALFPVQPGEMPAGSVPGV
jgi:glutathione S-transferase